MGLPDGAASIFVAAMRVSKLDSQGYVNPGADTFAFNTGVKLNINPVMETGDDIVQKNANGDIAAMHKHGDMPKYHTITLELATPSPALQAALGGGVIFTDVSAALGAPTGLAATGQITGGSLKAGTYGYRCTQTNFYGESLAEDTVTASVASGTTGAVVLGGATVDSSAQYVRVYGRVQGGEQLIGSYPNLQGQATSAASGVGSPTELTVTALTQSIPKGTTFTIAGDTNTPGIVFTTTAYAPKGTVTLAVSVSESITTTIAAGAIIPVFVDTGVIAPDGAVPTVDLTGGPGEVGYQEPKLGIVGNPNGIAIEAWGGAYRDGFQDPDYPWFYYVTPRVLAMHRMQQDLTNANAQNIYEGQAYGNPNFGAGPDGAIPFDTSQAYQYYRCGSVIVPTGSDAPVAVAANV